MPGHPHCHPIELHSPHGPLGGGGGDHNPPEGGRETQGILPCLRCPTKTSSESSLSFSPCSSCRLLPSCTPRSGKQLRVIAGGDAPEGAPEQAARSPPRSPGEAHSAPPSCGMARGTALPCVLAPATLTRGHLSCFARGSNCFCAVINTKTRAPKPQLPGGFGHARGYSRPVVAEEEAGGRGLGQQGTGT